MISLKKSKLFTKFLIFGILMAVIPVVFFSTFSYINVSAQINKNVNMANLNLLKIIRDDVETKLLNVDQKVYELSILPSTFTQLNVSSYKYNWETFENINQLKKEIEKIRFFTESSYGMDIDVILVNELGDWIIKNGSFYPSKYGSMDDQIKLIDETLKHDNATISKIGTKIIYNEETIQLVRGIYSTDGKHYGTFLITIPKNQLFSKMKEVGDTENFIILNKSNEAVLNYNSQINDLPTDEFIKKYSSEAAGKENFIATISSKRWNINTSSSKYCDWIYIKAVTYRALDDKSVIFGAMLITIALSMLAVAIFAIYMFSKKLYKPIDAMINNVKLNSVIDDSADEFEVISNYMTSINDSRRLLEGMLEEQRGQIRTMFFSNLLKGKLSQSQTEARAASLNLPTYCKWFSISHYKIENISQSGFERFDTDLVMFAVKNVAEELLDTSKILYCGVFENDFIIIHKIETESQAEAEKYLADAAKKLIAVITSSLHVQFGCGISNLFTNLRDASEAYLNTTDALKYRERTDENCIGFYSKIVREHKETFIFPTNSLNGLMNSITEKAFDKAKAHLHTFVDTLFRQSVGYPEFEYSIIKFVLNLTEYINEQRQAKGNKEQFQMPEMSELLSIGYSRDVEKWLLDNILVPLFEEFGKERQLTLSEQIIKIIRDEYDTPLTLEYCSSKIGYHSSYVSRMFRQQIGYSFKEYLYLYRIEKSKKLLSFSDMKIQDISNKLCYNNSQNFIRMFKKVEGITPGEYRLKHQEKDSK